MGNSLGFSGLNNTLNSADPNQEIFDNLSVLNSQLITGRVVDIILSNTHPLFNDFGGWNGLGTIFFEPISNLEKSSVLVKPTALPLLPYSKNLPLVNEIVVLLSLPSKNINITDNNKQTNTYYYINPISIWNSNHHNAFPNLFQPSTDNPQQANYQEIEAGATIPTQTTNNEVNLNSPLIGGTFKERSNIHPLIPFAGDIINEGRWGNSIRLGSTVSGSNNTSDYQSNWSFVGDDGDPITILRNGQPKDASKTGWLPIVENIREDLSSIYMTSYQQIPLRASNEDYSALSPAPLLPREFFNPQIILNSERLIFNATTDSILASAQDSISLSSDNQIGLTSKNVNISGQSIKLGGPTANEPAILGGAFMNQFRQLVEQIQVMALALSGLEGFDPTATNIESSGIDLAAQDLGDVCKNIKKLLPSGGKITSPLLSNTVRIK
jgi:hypothetical protein|tara:strand:- start:5394 stop:6710 length:1317 start_codon:yes stop_codon:yes gene_type:complete